jgi:hypothetical protein
MWARKPSTEGNGRPLSIDVDIRVRGKGLVITPAQVAKIVMAAIAALAAVLVWALKR